MKTLIIVDPQNDFMPNGNLSVKDGDKIIPFINEIIPNYNFTIITQDSHPKDHGSFASVNKVKPFSSGKLNNLDQIFWPDHCIIGTKGWEFHPDLKINNIKNLLIIPKGKDKTVDSYSAFFDNAKKNKTKLSGILKKHKVKELDIVGLATDYCVKYTALDAIDEGFNVNLLLRGCRAIKDDINQDIEEMKTKNIKIIE